MGLQLLTRPGPESPPSGTPNARARVRTIVSTAQGVARAGDRATAYLLLSRALELDPNDAEAWLWRGGTTLDPEEAISCLERVLWLDPTNPRARRGLTDLRDQAGWVGLRPAEPPTPQSEPKAAGSAGRRSRGLGLGLLVAASLLLAPQSGREQPVVFDALSDGRVSELTSFGHEPLASDVVDLDEPTDAAAEPAPTEAPFQLAAATEPERHSPQDEGELLASLADPAEASAAPAEAEQVALAPAEPEQAAAPLAEPQPGAGPVDRIAFAVVPTPAEPTDEASATPSVASEPAEPPVAGLAGPGHAAWLAEAEVGADLPRQSASASAAPTGNASAAVLPPAPATTRPWVAVHRATALWSGPDQHARLFRFVEPGTRFQVALPQDGPRLYVWDPTTRNYAYITALDVGPAGAPTAPSANAPAAAPTAPPANKPASGGSQAEVTGAKPRAGGQTVPATPPAPVPRAFWSGLARVTMYTCVELGGCNRTASGVWPYEGVVAVDPRIIPLGSKVVIDGLGTFVAADTGGAIYGNRIDVFVHSYPQAIQWGVRYLNAAAYHPS